jgi:hypothetical protein
MKIFIADWKKLIYSSRRVIISLLEVSTGFVSSGYESDAVV